MPCLSLQQLSSFSDIDIFYCLMNVRQCGLVLFFKGSICNLGKNIFNYNQHRICLGLICIICIMILVFLWWIRALLCLTSINHSKKVYFLPQRSYTTKDRAAKKVDLAKRRWEWKMQIRTDSWTVAEYY